MLSTAAKIGLARSAAAAVRTARAAVGLESRVRCTRKGLQWQLDLEEGIDFSIWLLGCFEPATVRAYGALVRQGDTVLDIGANIGAHTLHLSRLVGPAGRCVAFEPTTWAFEKLKANLALNPELATRVDALQTLLASSESSVAEAAIYSSWPLVTRSEELHAIHLGRLMKTEGCAVETVDHVLERLAVDRVAFVKLDVDGNEFSVLEGATRLFKQDRPVFLLELAPDAFSSNPGDFDSMIDLLHRSSYRLYAVGRDDPLPKDPRQMRARVPRGGGLNAIARPA